LRDQENCKTYFDDYIMNGKLSTCCLLRLSDYSMYFDMRKDISNELIVNQEAIKNLLKGFDSKEFKEKEKLRKKASGLVKDFYLKLAKNDNDDDEEDDVINDIAGFNPEVCKIFNKPNPGFWNKVKSGLSTFKWLLGCFKKSEIFLKLFGFGIDFLVQKLISILTSGIATAVKVTYYLIRALFFFAL